MTEVWIRARAYATGERWMRWHAGSLVEETPSSPEHPIVAALDRDVPSVALARAANGTWLVSLTGYETSQRRTNTPRTTATFLLLGEERECRALAASLIAGLAEPPESSFGAQVTAQVVDGPDTVTFGVDRGLDELLAAGSAARSTAGAGGSLPAGRIARTHANLHAVAAALAGDAPLPEGEVAVVVTGRLAEDAPPLDAGATLVTGEAARLDSPTEVEAELDELDELESLEEAAIEARVLTSAPARPARVLAGVLNGLALAGLVVTLVLFVIASRAAVDLADDIRGALGFNPPLDGVDWFQVVVLLAVFAAPVAAVILVGRLLQRRFNRRLAERYGPTHRARPFAPSRSWDRKEWMVELLQTPHWAPLLEDWRARGDFVAPAREWSDADYRRAASLARAELDERVSAVALTTGTAVAVAPRRFADAVAVVAGSAELQIEVLATLGLRPTARAWLHIAKAASTGLLASTYIDAEDRIEIRLLVRGAALGLDSSGALLEDAGDEMQEALSEALEGGGGIGGAIATAAGATVGITGSVIRQVSDFVAQVGDEIAEGVIVAAVLHYHGMSLVADALALDDAHRAELAPRLGHVPASLKTGGAALARRSTNRFRRLLRNRITQATRRAPASVRERFRRKTTTT